MNRNSVKPLKDLLDSVRDIDGFPIGKDEDILALSDPPFYTACPNPYIKEFIEEYGTPYDPENDDYHREPFVGGVREGKNDPIYNAHSYHTKVPHKAIMKYIEHYTKRGDIVLDGFSGTGMTGVAANVLHRKAIISDIAPIATFISSNYNRNHSLHDFESSTNELIRQVQTECGWMYETDHHTPFNDIVKGKINYTVWSDVLLCPYCNSEYVFGEIALDPSTNKVQDAYTCPSCDAHISKKECKHATMTYFDSSNKEITQNKQVPFLINYSVGTKRYEKNPDENDMKVIEIIEKSGIPYWYPRYKMMFRNGEWGDIWRSGYHLGITHAHHFYYKRNLWVYAAFWSKCKNKTNRWALSAIQNYINKKQSYTGGGGGMPGVLYIASLVQEKNVIDVYSRKLRSLKDSIGSLPDSNENAIVSTQSATDLSNIKDNSIDYVFTDPPFGSNIMYSEASFLWESWLQVFTNNDHEAIMNKTQNKELSDYGELIFHCFSEYFRVLKPNRWITIEFHNSKASVWNTIQEAMARAGFIIAQVSVLDKKQGSFKQVTSPRAVKNDLIINAYKPQTDFSNRFLKNAGEGMEVDFVIQQFEHLPVRPNIERTEKMLYSKMLAHYVQNGFKVRYDSSNFYKLLSDNFTELDGNWFMDAQAKKYNKWKSGLSLDELREKFSGQQVLFVSDEKSALTWLDYYLASPKTYSDAYTGYQQVATTTDDAIPELRKLLDNNFILEDEKYRRPLSESEKAEVEKNHGKELERAFNRLLKQAKEGKGKIKNVRREALVYGFTKCYQDGRYQDILTVAEKLYKSTLESSGEIMDFIDIARIKTVGEMDSL